MKILFLITLLFFSPATWLTDFNEAKELAQKENKYILIYFSGSDWCSHCKNMKKNIYDQQEFQKFAERNLVLVNADFPKKKKNRISDDQIKKNEQLEVVFETKGRYPISILTDQTGKELKRWEGDPGISAQDFIRQIKSYTETPAKASLNEKN